MCPFEDAIPLLDTVLHTCTLFCLVFIVFVSVVNGFDIVCSVDPDASCCVISRYLTTYSTGYLQNVYCDAYFIPFDCNCAAVFAGRRIFLCNQLTVMIIHIQVAACQSIEGCCKNKCNT